MTPAELELFEKREFRSIANSFIELKADTAGRFEGYASTFNRDVQGDRIAPGAFGETINENKAGVPILMHHSLELWSGLSIDLAEDAKGLWMSAQLFMETSYGKDAYGTLKGAKSAGFPTGLSIGFSPEEVEYDEGSQTRIIKKLRLWEVSITPWPANPKARVTDVKTVRNLERLVRDATSISAEQAKTAISICSAFLLQPPRDARGNELLLTDGQLQEAMAHMEGRYK